jgi:peptidoglycan/LPS O-acetylase OafA/YrhL
MALFGLVESEDNLTIILRPSFSFMQQRFHLTGLDALRGLAALYVMLRHYTERFNDIYPEFPKPIYELKSYPAVWMFFIISGFVIFLSLGHNSTPRKFAEARFWRLYPAFWAAVLITFVLVTLFGLPKREASFGEMLFNLTMIPDVWEGWNVAYVDGAYWSMQVLWFFYALVFVVICFKARTHIPWIFLGLLSLSILDNRLWKQNTSHSMQLLRTVTNLDMIHWFAMGMCIYRWTITPRLERNQQILTWGVFLFTLLAIRLRLGSTMMFYGIFLFVLVFLGVLGRLKWLEHRPFIFLGTISYSLYLVHQNIGYLVMRAGLAANLNIHLCIILAVIVALAIATLLTFTIELPVTAWFKRQTRRTQEPQKDSLIAPTSSSP